MSKDPSGKSLEKAVARIQEMIDPQSTVSHNEIITDRLGNARQFDVVVRGSAAGRNYLAVIECKDWSERLGTPEVEAFVAKARNVNANIILMVSKKGFSEPALNLAKHEGVGTLSLLPNDQIDAGFSLGVRCYAKYYRWNEYRYCLHYPIADDPIGEFKIEEIMLEGKPVSAYFHNQIAKNYENLVSEGEIVLNVTFKKPQLVKVNGTLRNLTGITFIAIRECIKKCKYIRVRGDGIFDWNSKMTLIPPNGQVVTEPFFPNFPEWDDFDGDIDTEMKNEKKVPICNLLYCPRNSK